MKSVTVRNTVIGEGVPKVCVPVAAATIQEICEQARSIMLLPADLLEWRADWYEDVFSPGAVRTVLSELREIIGDLPLLMTFRTRREGGEKEAGRADYTRMIIDAAQTGLADIADVEISSGKDTFRYLADELHAAGVRVLGSSHDFAGTPDKEELVARMLEMQDLGADILKIAVMPHDMGDVMTLLEAALEMKGRNDNQPVVAISMSRLGAVSRIAAEAFGSAVTFGSAAIASAPGQIGAKDLKYILDILHEDIE